MPNLPYQIITIGTNVVMLLFMIYYIWRLHTKEVELERKTHKIDSDYHATIDNALVKERKIIEDATQEANQIIEGAQYISKSSEDAIGEAMRKMVAQLEAGATQTSQQFMQSYESTLKQMSSTSLNDISAISKGLETDYASQIKDFHDKLLPSMQKELEAYKANRIKEVEINMSKITQKVVREVINKSISLEDHEKLVIEALEKAKLEGTFN